ncbi:MAG: amidohydrolase family protein, partial [Arenicella sp.]|nr:amidohydrolase family protein [Arenicella sp.]
HLEEIMNAINREFGDYGYENTDEFLAFVKTRGDEIARDLRQHDIAVTTTLWLVESFVQQKVDIQKVLREVEFEYENPGISEWSKRAGRGIGWLPDVNRYKWPDDITETRKAKSIKYWQTYAKACQLVLQSLVRNGVEVFAGTDANLPPTVPGFSLHDELISMNKAGMSPSQVLLASTAKPAEWMNIKAGKISPGYTANLVLLNKNPLIDISNTKAIDAVILNGQLFDRAQLDKMLSAVKAANDASRKVDISAYLN